MVRISLCKSRLVADFFHDGSGRARPTVIMLGGSEGGKFWSRPKRLLQAFMEREYNLLSLAYFKADGLPSSLEEIPLGYFNRAFAALDCRPEVACGDYALIGASKGAEAALLLGCYYDRVAAVVALSPSSVVWQGVPRNRFDLKAEAKSSWTYRGEPVPFLATPFTNRDLPALLTLRLRKVGERALADWEGVRRATIPAEKIQGPILLLSGRKDAVWPATDMAESVVRRLESHEFEYPYEHLVYDSGHNGLIRNRSCWRTVFDFLDNNFRPDARYYDKNHSQQEAIYPKG